jgi:hypothetical protein
MKREQITLGEMRSNGGPRLLIVYYADFKWSHRQLFAMARSRPAVGSGAQVYLHRLWPAGRRCQASLHRDEDRQLTAQLKTAPSTSGTCVLRPEKVRAMPRHVWRTLVTSAKHRAPTPKVRGISCDCIVGSAVGSANRRGSTMRGPSECRRGCRELPRASLVSPRLNRLPVGEVIASRQF